MHAFIYGVVLAFGLIIPLGAQNIFIFNQGASSRRFLEALPSVLTATLCDAALILLAVLGVSLFVLTIPWLKTTLLLIGLVFLIYMGWITWNSKPSHQEAAQPLSVKKQIAFALSVSLFNPHAILDTVGVIGTSSLDFTSREKMLYAMACILVSFSWFLTLSLTGRFIRKIDNEGTWLLRLNKLSAIIIWAVAIYLICILFF